MYQSGHSI
jgi:hypothetical protein